MNKSVMLTEEIKTKWKDIVENKEAGEIKTRSMRNNITRLLENSVQEGVLQDLSEVETTAAGSTGIDSDTALSGGKWDPVIIAMVRRTMPQLIANELMGVQPMTGPTGLIFAMQPVYRTTKAGITTGDDAFGSNVPVPGYSGDGTTDADATGITTNAGEVLGADKQVTTDPTAVVDQTNAVVQTNPWAEMGFTITKTSVTAVTRALKAHYTDELAQDLRVIHGMDAEQELSTILTTEVIAEINREMVGIIRAEARAGATWATTPGTVDVTVSTGDSDGRWEGELFAYIDYAISREANAIALATRRGRGNFVITSSDVVTALEYANKLRTDQALAINVNNTVGIGTTFVGTLSGGTIRVYMDPYLATNEVIVGYKGANQYDAGYFYCPYVPLQMYKARGEEDFQPRIGMKTRYGVVGHPQHSGAAANDYYRKFTVAGI